MTLAVILITLVGHVYRHFYKIFLIAKTKNKHVPMSFYHTLLYNDTNVYYTQICKVNETNQAGVLQSKVLL